MHVGPQTLCEPSDSGKQRLEARRNKQTCELPLSRTPGEPGNDSDFLLDSEDDHSQLNLTLSVQSTSADIWLIQKSSE